MDRRELFQAVRDMDNPDEIEQKGPFKCSRADAWLGEGYYFWESFIDLAHWWGKESLNNNYMICRSYCEASFPYTFDLYNNPEHLKQFQILKEVLIKEYTGKFVTVPFVLEMFKAHSDFSKEFKAIRAKAERCWRNVPRLPFKKNSIAYLETVPPVQVCILDKSFLIDEIYEIVYPDKYIIDGVV